MTVRTRKSATDCWVLCGVLLVTASCSSSFLMMLMLMVAGEMLSGKHLYSPAVFLLTSSMVRTDLVTSPMLEVKVWVVPGVRRVPCCHITNCGGLSTWLVRHSSCRELPEWTNREGPPRMSTWSTGTSSANSCILWAFAILDWDTNLINLTDTGKVRQPQNNIIPSEWWPSDGRIYLFSAPY